MTNELTLNHYPFNDIQPKHVPSVLVPYLHDRIIKPIITKSKYLSFTESYQFPLTTHNKSKFFSTFNSLIYVSSNSNEIDNKDVDIIDRLSIENSDDVDLDSIKCHVTFPLLCKQVNLIKIPKKVKTTLIRHVSNSLLRKINPDINVAVELCLLFLSNLTSTQYYYNNSEILDDEKRAGWKRLNSRILEQTFGKGYRRIIEALMEPTSKGSILERGAGYIPNVKSYSYRLGEAYIGKGIQQYYLKEKYVESLLSKSYYAQMARAEENAISRNLLNIYQFISLPSIQVIHNEAKRLIKSGYVTNKGKRLTYLNNHSRSYFKNPKELSFVEDAIEIFNFVTSNGFMTPIGGDEKSGGRIVDSFTLMPKWIRRLVKINGVPIVGVDYKCLHPNIAMNLYNGNKKFITHESISIAAGVDKLIVKQEHLAFFNKHPEQMKKSPLYNYYMATEGQLLKKIINEKYNSTGTYNITSNKDSYKITSRRMFQVEVNLMTSVIEKLNSEGIYVLYVYDALACHPNDAERVKQVMDEVALQKKVYTTSSIEGSDIANTELQHVQTENLLLDNFDLFSSYTRSLNPPSYLSITQFYNDFAGADIPRTKENILKIIKAKLGY